MEQKFTLAQRMRINTCLNHAQKEHEKWNEDQIKAAYQKSGFSDEEVSLLRDYFYAANYLYGSYTLEDLLQVLEEHGMQKWSKEDLLALSSILMHEDPPFYRVPKAFFTSGKDKTPDMIINLTFVKIPINGLYTLRSQQEGLDLYIPEQKEFLKWKSPEYFGAETPGMTKLKSYLKKRQPEFVHHSGMNTLMKFIVSVFQYGSALYPGYPIEALVNDFGFKFKGEDDVRKFVSALMTMQQQMHKWSQRGYVVNPKAAKHDKNDPNRYTMLDFELYPEFR